MIAAPLASSMGCLRHHPVILPPPLAGPGAPPGPGQWVAVYAVVALLCSLGGVALFLWRLYRTGGRRAAGPRRLWDRKDQALLRTAIDAVVLLVSRLRRRVKAVPPGRPGAGP